MELRHLRYFVAVAEECSFTQAAEHRLHTAQPSLSRQIRDLEQDLGVQLILRGPRAMELTPAGRVFLDHARVILLQAETAREAARRAARPTKHPFVVGFLTGYELEWLPRIMQMLSEHLQSTELTIHSAGSPELTAALLNGSMDVAFLRPDDAAHGLAFRPVAEEELFALLPAGHRLAAGKAVRPVDIASQAFISFPKAYSPALRQVIDDYLVRSDVHLVPVHEAETLPMVISLVRATGGVSLLPDYARRLLPPSVVARKLHGRAPSIMLAVGHNPANKSTLLQSVLAQIESFVRPVASDG